MNYFKIEIACETPLSYEEMCKTSFDDVVTSIEGTVKGQVGYLACREIDEHGNDDNVYIKVLSEDNKSEVL